MKDLLFVTDYELLVFDVDGTLADSDSGNLYHGAAMFFDWLRRRQNNKERVPSIALATNQGNVGLRYWMLSEDWGNPHLLPSLADVHTRLVGIQSLIPLYSRLYVAYAYRNRSNGRWSPTPMQFAGWSEWSRNWVKPSPGMLLQAMSDYKIADSKSVLMIGDQVEDKAAAESAKTRFLWSEIFHDKISASLFAPIAS